MYYIHYSTSHFCLEVYFNPSCLYVLAVNKLHMYPVPVYLLTNLSPCTNSESVHYCICSYLCVLSKHSLSYVLSTKPALSTPAVLIMYSWRCILLINYYYYVLPTNHARVVTLHACLHTTPSSRLCSLSLPSHQAFRNILCKICP